MKKSFLAFFVLISILNLKAQTTGELEGYILKIEKQRAEYWKNKQYDEAAGLLKNALSLFNSQSKELQNKYQNYYYGTLYNIACAFSLNNQKDSSLFYLQKAITAGYSDYMNARSDTDFDNVRNDPKFAELILSLKEKGDYEYILKKSSLYKSNNVELPEFTYQAPDSKVLTELRKKYNLDSVAGNGTEISKFINLMKWVHGIVKHDGNSANPKIKTADALIEICKKENRGVNCRMMATMLNEVYLSMGYKSRFITCMPKGEIFDDCHVINEVYSKSLNKWLWMDPTFETYVTDDKGNYLSIRETRYRLVNNLPVKASEGINWNGTAYSGGGKKYLYEYMTKNLYRFSIALNSCSAFENIPMAERTYVELYPSDYNPKNVELGKITNGVFYTTDENRYWSLPLEK